MERRHHTRFVGLTVALLALAGFVGSAYAEELQSWDQNIAKASKRFKVLSAFNNEAVRDNNTGLVWEQAPDTTGGPNSDGLRTWGQSTDYCANKSVGGTVGWRLPSVIELNSVRDPALAAPFVPASVFTGVQSADYWSATTPADNPAVAWVVGFFLGGDVDSSFKTGSTHAWCVRGEMNADQY